LSFFIGVELGQVSDVTAIAVVQSLTLPFLRTEEIREKRWVSLRPVYQGPDGKEVRDHPPVNFALRHLERIPADVSYPEIVSRVESLHGQLRKPAVVLDATGVGKAAVELFRRSNFNLSVFTLMAGDQMIQDGSSYRIPKRDVISTTQVLLQTGRLKIARSLPHAALLARELVNFHFKVGHTGPEDALDWREGPDDDLVLALAIAAWEAERNPGLGFSCGYCVSEFGAGRVF
jgi:hypothetical protein